MALAWQQPGKSVEVEMREEGLTGSRYTARIVEVAGKRVHVEFDDFFEEGSEVTLLRDWVKMDQLRPPPPATPPDFFHGLGSGDALELRHEDGWWAVQYMERRAAFAPSSTRHGHVRH